MTMIRTASRMFSLVGALTTAVGICLAAGVSAAPNPAGYPDTAGYQPVSSVEIFKVVGASGVWFSSPHGVLCGIEDDGSFGCTGELAGVPAGENEVAWFTGDPFPRLYQTPSPRFSAPTRHMLLLRLHSISYRGTRCAATPEGTVYCIHRDNPDSQIMITTTATLRGRDALPAA